MRRGDAGELALVMLARGLVARSAADPADLAAQLGRPRVVPPVISPACAALLGDALAQVWPALWRRGGSRPGASVQAAVVRRGRIWERHAPIGLTFSVATLQLLRWLVGALWSASSASVEPLAAAPLTVGDQVMVYLALDAVAGSSAQAAIAAQPLVRSAPLAWLGFADVLGAGSPNDLASLVDGAGAIVVEALTGELAERWRVVELRKRAIEAPARLAALGAAQDATLGGFLAVCENHRRRDLASFVIEAAAPLLARGIAPMPVRLDPTTPLGQRAAARVAAGALLRGVATWTAWDRAHRGVRFIDDGYEEAQLLLARFEPIGAAGAERAAAWLADLASLVPTTVPSSTATVDAT